MRAALLIAAGAIAFNLPLATQAVAGDGNTIYIKQESPAGTTNGNTLSVDQSDANYSRIAGPNPAAVASSLGITLDSALQGLPTPALQRGEGNQATLEMTGNDGVLLLLQDTSPFQALQLPGSGTSNQATAIIAGSSTGAIVQMGTRNEANLELTNSRGLISQFGSDLSASLNVRDGGRGQIVQIGRRNEAGLEVDPGASATLTQVGSNLTYVQTPDGVNQAATFQVMTTNPGNITITQTGW